MLKFDASKYPPPPSEIATCKVTDPTICRSECRIGNLWVFGPVFGYLNLLSNSLCGEVLRNPFLGPLLEICSSTMRRFKNIGMASEKLYGNTLRLSSKNEP